MVVSTGRSFSLWGDLSCSLKLSQWCHTSDLHVGVPCVIDRSRLGLCSFVLPYPWHETWCDEVSVFSLSIARRSASNYADKCTTKREEIIRRKNRGTRLYHMQVIFSTCDLSSSDKPKHNNNERHSQSLLSESMQGNDRLRSFRLNITSILSSALDQWRSFLFWPTRFCPAKRSSEKIFVLNTYVTRCFRMIRELFRRVSVDQRRYRSIDPRSQSYSVHYENRCTKTTVSRSWCYSTSGRQSSPFQRRPLAVFSLSSSMGHWIYCVFSDGFPIIEAIMYLSLQIHRARSLNVKQWLMNFSNSSTNWRKWRITRLLPWKMPLQYESRDWASKNRSRCSLLDHHHGSVLDLPHRPGGSDYSRQRSSGSGSDDLPRRWWSIFSFTDRSNKIWRRWFMLWHRCCMSRRRVFRSRRFSIRRLFNN